jgi:hypothetical protein
MPKSPSPDERARASAQRPKAAEAEQAGADSAQHPLLDLQRTVGNAHVARMLAQRAATPEEEEEQPGAIQAMPEVGMAGGPVSDELAGRINSSRGGGSALESGLRANMEQQLGASFEDVRVHTGAESHQLNRSISAQAFTTGSDIFLGAGASAADHSLMAHELTHVVQQRSMPASGPMTVGPAGDTYEQQADAVAAQITTPSATPSTAQREPEDA